MLYCFIDYWVSIDNILKVCFFEYGSCFLFIASFCTLADKIERVINLFASQCDFLITLIHALASLLPNFSSLGRPAAYVAYNFNVYGDFLARQCITTFIYVLAISIIGYFLLKTREIAA